MLQTVTELELRCDNCGSKPTIRLGSRNVCRCCALAAIDAVSPPPTRPKATPRFTARVKHAPVVTRSAFLQ